MKTEVKKIDGTKREINIEVTGDIVKNKFEDVFKRIGKDAKFPGFRVGHVPRDILEKHFSSDANRIVLEELIPDIYNQAIEKENLDVIESPQISDVKLDRSNLLFKAKVEVRPEIILKDYKKIKITYRKIEVTSEQLKRQIDTLKESRKIDALDDAFARGLGYPNLSELEKATERQILLQKENTERLKIENEIVEQLLKNMDFKLPQTLVNRQLDDLIRQAKLDLALKGMSREKIDEQEKTLVARLEPEARKQVKLYLVLAEIAKKENIPLDDHMPSRAMEFLLREADWQEGGNI